jgi:hypothetical protein
LVIGNATDLTYTNDPGFSRWSTSAFGAGQAGHYMARAWTQLGGSIYTNKFYDSVQNGQVFPTPVQGEFSLGHWWITETSPVGASSGITRGYLPGLLQPHNIPNFAELEIYVGIGDLEGRTYLFAPAGWWSIWLEISNTW